MRGGMIEVGADALFDLFVLFTCLPQVKMILECSINWIRGSTGTLA